MPLGIQTKLPWLEIPNHTEQELAGFSVERQSGAGVNLSLSLSRQDREGRRGQRKEKGTSFQCLLLPRSDQRTTYSCKGSWEMQPLS